MAGYDYAAWLQAVNAILEFDLANTTTDAPFGSPNADANAWVARAIEYAEQRIYRELDLLATRVADDSAETIADTRIFTLPTSMGTFIVLEQVKIEVGGIFQPPLLPVSKDALEAMWPFNTAPTVPSIPRVWCPVDGKYILLGPAPDAQYPVECFGTIRPTPLSAENPVTDLTTYLPDVFLAATMISWSAFQRDYGQGADDPKLALSWEQVYGDALKSAGVEEFRKKLMSQGWSTRQPNPLATPPQT